jgi:hypothetical protein
MTNPANVDAFIAQRAFEYRDDSQDAADRSSFVADAVQQDRFTADGVKLEALTRQRREGRAALLAEQRKMQPQFAQQFHRERIAPYDAETQEKFVGPQVAALEEYVNKTAEKFIVTQPEIHAPRDVIHATTINGVCLDARNYAPPMLVKMCRDAIALGDLATIQRLHPVVASLASYRQPFASNGEVHDVVREMSKALDTPKQRRSRAAQAWRDDALSEIKILVAQATDPRGDVGLFASTGALRTLFPDKKIPR